MATAGDESGLMVRQALPVDPRLTVEYAARVHLPEARFFAGNSSRLSLSNDNFEVHLKELCLRFMV